MRTLKFLTMALLSGLLVLSCDSTSTKKSNDFSKGAVDSVSKYIGYSLASMVKQSDFGALNHRVVMKAYKEMMARTEDPTQDEMMEWNNEITSYMQKKSMMEGERNLEEGMAFLEENKDREGVITLPSGLQYKVIREGSDVRAKETDTVEVHYVGTLIDGTEFDSSYSRNEPPNSLEPRDSGVDRRYAIGRRRRQNHTVRSLKFGLWRKRSGRNHWPQQHTHFRGGSKQNFPCSRITTFQDWTSKADDLWAWKRLSNTSSDVWHTYGYFCGSNQWLVPKKLFLQNNQTTLCTPPFGVQGVFYARAKNVLLPPSLLAP